MIRVYRGAAPFLAVALVAACSGGSDEPWFKETGRAAGLVFDHRTGFDGRHLFPEIVGGGGALFDMDGDGDLDAYLVQSGSLTAPDAEPDGNRLFRNRGDGTFDDVTEESGTGDRGYGMGVAAGDYDNDGDVDLYVTNYGPNVLLRNDGDGTFTDVSVASGTEDEGWGASAGFLDYDADGDLDLFVVNYIDWTMRTEQDCYSAAGPLDYCMPTNYNAPARDVLLRNDGDGKFIDVSVAAGLDAAFGNGLGIVSRDFDGNGWHDVFVANDTMMNQLWLNQGDGTFRDESLLRGCALDEHGLTKAGMGTVAGDYDNDGDIDLVVVNLGGQTDSFFTNENGFFSDTTGNVGLGAASRRYTRFGLGLVDLDNDGRLDLYEANGRVIRSGEPLTDDPYAEPNVIFRGEAGGRFVELLPRGGTADPLIATSRAAVFGDVNGDGGLDVLVVNRDGPAHLLINRVPARGGWVRFQVLESSDRDALGAVISLTAGGQRVTRTVSSASSYLTANDPRVHVGLGSAEGVTDVRVRWVDGSEETFGDFPAGREATLARGQGG